MLNCWKSLTLSVLMISAVTNAGSAKDALSTLEAATASISQHKARLVSQKVDLINQLSARQKKSALAAVNSGLLHRLADNMEQSVTNHRQYLTHLDRFFLALDQDSPCYLPDSVDEERDKLAKQQQIAEQVRAFDGAANTEEEATGVMVAVSTLATVNMLTTSQLPILKLCVLAELMPQGEVFAIDESDSEWPKRNQGDVEIEQYDDVVELTEHDSLNLNDWMPVLITSKQQISSLKFSNDVRVDRHFNLVIPKAALAKNFSFNITGQLSDEEIIYQLNVSVQRTVDTPLASLTISNAALKSCIDNITSLSRRPMVEQLRVLQCQFERPTNLSGEELTQLSHLQSLELSSVTISDFGQLSAIESLTTVILNNSTIEAFPVLREAGASVLLSHVTIADWSSLARLNSAHVQIETDDCDSVAQLAGIENVLVLYQNVDNDHKMISLLSIDDDKRPTVINTNCNAQ